MLYSKRIEIDNLKEIQQELIDYDFFKELPDIENVDAPLDKSSLSGISFSELPDLPKLKNFLNTTINTNLVTHFHIINVGPNGQSDIHQDVDDSPWALNIPIVNCEHSNTVWYDENNNEIERICLDVIHFLKVGQYHQILNHSNDNRMVMTIRFAGTYSLSDIIK